MFAPLPKRAHRTLGGLRALLGVQERALVATLLVGGPLARQLQEAGIASCVELTGLDGAFNRATGLLIVLAIAEPAAGAERRDVLKCLVDCLVDVPQLQLSHAG